MNKETLYIVKNRSDGIVIYSIKEDNVRREFHPGEEKRISFSELEKRPSGIDKDDLVFHLSDDDFQQLFDVTFETFKTWKGWKQQSEKQKAGLW